MIFFGTSDFAAKLLDYTISQGIAWQAIVTRPDRPQGRKLQLLAPPVKQLYQEKNLTIPLLQPEKVSTEEFAHILKTFHADLFVVVAFGEILRQHILDIPKKGAINIHASLLPHHRGAAPMQRCLWEGACETGVTIQEMTLQMDAGDILAATSFPVPLDWDLGILKQVMLEKTKPLLLDTLKNIDAKRANKKKQNETLVSFAPKIRVEEMRLDWKEPTIMLHNKVRALSPDMGAWTTYQSGTGLRRIKLMRTFPFQSPPLGEVGQVFLIQEKKKVVAQTIDGFLEIVELIPEGKKKMSGLEFHRGCREVIKFI